MLKDFSLVEKNTGVKIYVIENTNSIRIIGKIKTMSAHVAKQELIKIIKT